MRIKDNLVLRRIGDESIIIVPDKDTVNMTEVYTLNEASVAIWEHFDNKDFTAEQIVEFVIGQYDVDRERATNDVKTFIDFLKRESLIIDD
jgi:hypothetical protein